MGERERIIRRKTLRKKRSSSKIFGTNERPRISIFKSNKYIYLQAIDDTQGYTLLALSGNKNLNAVLDLAKKFAVALLKKGIKKAVLDRSGYPYHGKVKALTESLREKGIII